MLTEAEAEGGVARRDSPPNAAVATVPQKALRKQAAPRVAGWLGAWVLGCLVLSVADGWDRRCFSLSRSRLSSDGMGAAPDDGR